MDSRALLQVCLEAVAAALTATERLGALSRFRFIFVPVEPLWFDKPSAPAAPDYTGAAKATGESNIQAAIANSLLSQRTQVTPLGTLSYSQTGSTNLPGDPGGLRYDATTQRWVNAPAQPGTAIPQYTSNVTLDPRVQGLLDTSLTQQTGLSNLANSAVTRTGEALDKPFSLEGASPDYNQQVADALMARSTRYLDPQWQQNEETERTRLANSGFTVGSEGYGKAYDQFARTKDAAYSNARDTATAAASSEGVRQRQQDITEMLLARQQPLQELNALRTGAAPQMPSFTPSGAQSVGGADLLSAANASGAAKNQIYNADVGAYNANMGGLYGLGSAALMAYFMSDDRTKENLVRVGSDPRGWGVYEFNYKGSATKQVGWLSSEVKAVRPDLVLTFPDGFDRVNYGEA